MWSDCDRLPDRSPFSVLSLSIPSSSYPFTSTPTKNTLLFSLSLSLSQGEKALPCGEAFPIDPSPTEDIPGLTATSSSIPSRYFIDFPSLSTWISLPRVHNVKDEDSFLGHGFVGLMVGIVL
jgi:hypothetical protein